MSQAPENAEGIVMLDRMLRDVEGLIEGTEQNPLFTLMYNDLSR
jgi:hypothetical protein